MKVSVISHRASSHSSARRSSHDARQRGVALLAMVIVLGLFGVLATVSHLVGMDRVREAWALRESSAALFAAEAGLATALALWDTTALDSLAPGVTIGAGSGRLANGDAYEARITRLDDGSGAVRYYVIESTGRSRGAWRGRRALRAFVKVGPEEPLGGELEDVGEPAGDGVGDAAGGSMGTVTELHLPHPLAQFRWLEILE